MTYPNPIPEKGPLAATDDLKSLLTGTEVEIYTRRSVRIFRKKPVEPALVHRILEAGRFAPSAGNGQPLKMVVVTDPDVNRAVDRAAARVLGMIERLYAGTGWWRRAIVTLLSWIDPRKWDQRPVSAMAKVRASGGVITFDAPVVIHIAADRRGISNPELDAGIAAQNMVLCAQALGLGTCYIGFIASAAPYAPAVNRLLGIKYPWKIAVSLCVGYPGAAYAQRPVPRGPMPVEWIGGDGEQARGMPPME